MLSLEANLLSQKGTSEPLISSFLSNQPKRLHNLLATLTETASSLIGRTCPQLTKAKFPNPCPEGGRNNEKTIEDGPLMLDPGSNSICVICLLNNPDFQHLFNMRNKNFVS